MNPKSITCFGLIRHGKTQWNLEKKIQGKNDLKLCAEGVMQVQAWGKILGKTHNWDRIVTSNLKRTWETAGIINKDLNLPMEKDHRLDEQDWGVWNGKKRQDFMAGQLKELERQMALGWQFCPPGGEDRLSVWKRTRNAFEDMASRFQGKNILVVTHSGVIRMVIYGILKRKFLPDERPLLKPYHLHLLAWDNGDLVIKSLNELKC
jgi:probable phosphoglycerate mutase